MILKEILPRLFFKDPKGKFCKIITDSANNSANSFL